MEQKKTLIELLGRALVDPKFREKLKSNRQGVAHDYQLSSDDKAALEKLDEKKLDAAAGNLAGRSDFTIEVVVSGHFDAK